MDERIGAYSAADESRHAPESSKSPSRTQFERDRARVIHSSALRRLGAKSQILVAGTDDFARTRLTHTLEVAQIGRQIGAMLGCNPDIVDAACLSHDLGHPPFGHNGEHALARLAHDIGGFEGNAQTLRLLTRLEPKVFFASGQSAGLNLTRASLDAVIKYPWTYADASEFSRDARSVKFGVYPDDMPVFEWVKENAPFEIVVNNDQTTGHRAGRRADRVHSTSVGVADITGREELSEQDMQDARQHVRRMPLAPREFVKFARPMECQVMDLADDIGYSVHDVEDSIATGAFDPAQLAHAHVIDDIVYVTSKWYGSSWDADLLTQAMIELRDTGILPDSFCGSRVDLARLKNATSALIGRFAGEVEHATRDTYGNGALTRYSANVVIPESTKYMIVALKGIAVYALMEPRDHEPMRVNEQKIVTDLVEVLMASSPAPSDALDPAFLDDWMHAQNDGERLRVAIDQVASLTDGSAMTLHAILCS